MTELITSIAITGDVVEHTTPAGAVIGAVTLAAGVTASIVGDHADKFEIFGAEIRVKDGHPIDYETFYVSPYVLEIEASDGLGGTQTYYYTFTQDGATVIDSVERQYGTEAGEVMYGDVGKDRYNAYGGADTIYGGEGDDWVTSGAGADLIYGGAGQDVLCYMDSYEAVNFNFATGLGVGGTADGDVTYSMERIYGSSYGDVFTGSAIREHMYGHDGDDTIYGGGGHDHLTGDAGHDEVHGGAGDDTFKDDSGDDYMYGDGGKDRFFAGSGGDHYDGGADIDTVNFAFSSEAVALNLKVGIGWQGDAASDSYTSIERIKGSHFDDWIVGSDSADRLYGNDGKDSVAGGSGEDYLRGGAGDDQIYGEAHRDVLHGDAGDDSLFGGGGDDRLYADEGADLIDGGDGVDNLYYAASEVGVSVNLLTGTGRFGLAEGDAYVSVERIYGSDYGDTLTGGDLNNRLYGEDGDDILTGGDHWDYLEGGAGADTMIGGAGGDTFIGNDGDDVETGGAGSDVFVFLDHGGSDYITDFEDGIDKLVFAGINGVSGFGDLTLTQTASDHWLVDYMDDGSAETLTVHGAGEVSLGVEDFLFT